MIMARILIFFSLGMAILTTGIALSNRLTIGDVSFSAQVSTIIDGDTFTVIQQQKKSVIRLYGVDCPEKAQPYGKQASQAAKALLCGKVVGIDPVDGQIWPHRGHCETGGRRNDSGSARGVRCRMGF